MGEERQDQRGPVHVAAVPPKPLPSDLLKRVASLLGQEIVDTRLLLAGEIPRILVSRPDADAANAMARSLTEAGLTAFVCLDAELRNLTAGFRARTARHGEREVIFGDRQGREVKIAADDAALIIRGRIRSAAQEKATTTKRKLLVAATLLAGGVPVMRRVVEQSAKETLQAEDLVRIYDWRSSDPRVEMSRSHVDFSFLGADRTSSSTANFDLAVTWLRERFPQAIFDDRLTGPFKTDGRVAGAGEAFEVECKLIYLGHLAIRQRQSDRPGPPAAT